MSVASYKDLIAWQKAMNLVEVVYALTRRFPKEELFCLTQQMRRAAISIPCNIAEGQGRQSTREFLNFLSIARGSLREVETQVLIARRLNYINDQQESEITELAAEVGRLINGLSNSLSRK